MKRNSIAYIILIISVILLGWNDGSIKDCGCNQKKTERKIRDKAFNALPQLDTCHLARLPYADNRLLWYRDVESPDTTQFTRQWSDFIHTNYHPSHADFFKYYRDKKDIELAFQFGPNDDMWAYHVFVVKKVDCCYLMTRSYYRNARFTYRAYAILGKPAVDSLFMVLDKQVKTPGENVDKNYYTAGFMDNRNKKAFFVDLMVEHDDVVRLYSFVDEKIRWTSTYGK